MQKYTDWFEVYTILDRGLNSKKLKVYEEIISSQPYKTEYMKFKNEKNSMNLN